MESKEILKFCIEKGLLLDKDILNLFKEVGDVETAKLVIEKVGQYTQKKVITKNLFNENREQVDRIFSSLPEENQKNVERLKIKLGLSIEISKEVEIKKDRIMRLPDFQDVKIISSVPVVNKKIVVGDFVKHFKNRFLSMKNILQEHSELNNLISINKISDSRQGISIIGIVSDKRVTKNGNMLLKVEDLTGTITVLINQNKPELFEQAQEITLDSVMGFKCSGNREIVFVNEIIFPEAILRERKNSPVEEYALFTGDLHVGSNNFMEENFLKFIDYLNGEVPNTSEVEKIKYLFIVGDLVSGVGIFPGQEKELAILDIEAQFERVAELLGKIRKDIKIIICPGNHDGVRIMEPQPILDEKYAWALHDMENVVLTQNPATINIGAKGVFSGFDVLAYHGYSFHYYANDIEHLMKAKAAHKPELIMAYLLKNRHLAPTHASTLYYPHADDPLLIRQIPDIFFAGLTHKSAVSYYNNILIISSSSWESMTGFQEKMGNEPDFCKVPMLNLKTRSVKILDFE